MTREEAINTLANFKKYISGGGATDRKQSQALDVAIKSLEAWAVIIKNLTDTIRLCQKANIPCQDYEVILNDIKQHLKEVES